MGSGWSQDEGSVPQQQRSNNTQVEARASPPVEKRAVTEVPLPHNYEAITKDADSPLDRSNIHTQLHAGLLLNNKTQKYWVDSKSNKNCFMLFARDLLITWAEDSRFWHWPNLTETSSSSETLIDVAELVNVCWLEVHGRFDTAKLTPKTVYEVKFVVKIKDPAYGWEAPVNMRLTLPDGTKQHHKENLMEKPRGQWIEIPVGELTTSETNSGEMEISVYEYEGGKWKKGLIIKGALIQPKN